MKTAMIFGTRPEVIKWLSKKRGRRTNEGT